MYAAFNDVDATVQYIKNFGLMAPIISFILVIFQAQIPYIPFFILVGANGIIFGFWPGLLLSWSAAVSGAAINFSIARFLGHDWFAKNLGEIKMQKIKKISNEKGFLAILVSRLIPVIPTSLINIAAGISEIRLNTFVAASAIGKLPFIFLYTFLGNEIIHAKNLASLITITAIVILISYVLFKKLSHRYK